MTREKGVTAREFNCGFPLCRLTNVGFRRPRDNEKDESSSDPCEHGIVYDPSWRYKFCSDLSG